MKQNAATRLGTLRGSGGPTRGKRSRLPIEVRSEEPKDRVAPAASPQLAEGRIGSLTNLRASPSGVVTAGKTASSSLNLNAAGAGEAASGTQWPIETAINAACVGVAPGSQHFFSCSQSGIRRPQRANAVFKAEVPADLTNSAARNGVVDILDPIPYALNQFSDALPVAAAKPCRSCGGYNIHHPWCPTLGLNVRTAFHPKEDGKTWTIQLAGSSPPSFGGFA